MTDTIKLVENDGFPYWEDNTGFRTPVIAGGSDGGVSVQDQVQGALDAAAGTDQQETSETPGSEQQETQQQESGTETSSSSQEGLAEGFLKGIPEADRPVVEKYIKQWDAGVTRRFQDIHNQYEPYKQLGEVDELKQAREVYGLLNENPQLVYNILAQEFGQAAAGEMVEELEQESQEDDPAAQFKQYLSPLEEQLTKQQQVVETLANIILQNEQQVRQQAEDRELNSYLNNLKTEFGEFDEEYVLAKIANGVSGEQAVKDFQGTLQKYAGSASKNLPPTLSGGGAPPPDSNVASLKSKDVRALVQNLVSKANQE